ncbi:MAG: hypothetical protein JKY37_19315 [Nannocystaceae bacterium]|nr:hypothetical protein [Nannocystaceae bacterium]
MRRVIPIALGIATSALILGACFDDAEPVTGVTSGASSDGGSTAEPEASSTGAEADTTGDTTGGPVECPATCFTGRCDDVGRCVRTVFVTSDTYLPDFNNSSGADVICNAEASGAELDGRFAALVATNGNLASAFQHAAISVDAPDAFTLPSQEFVGTSADLRPDVDSGALLTHAIDRGADGMPPPQDVGTACLNDSGLRVWTGLRIAQSMLETTGQCGDWNGLGNGGTGRFDELDLAWIGSAANCPCVDAVSSQPATARLYCVEVPQ